MPIVIFHNETGDEGLQINENGTATYFKRSSADGLTPPDIIMSAEQAKLEWPSFAMDIDRARAKMAAKNVRE